MFIFFALEPLSAHAKGKFVGIVYGYSAPSSDAASSRFSYGIQGGFDFSSKIGLGLTYVYSSQDLTYTSAGASTQYKFNMTFILADLTINADSFVKGMFFGAKLGFTNMDFASYNSVAASTSVAITGLSSTFGPKMGYDYEVGKAFSIGGEINYLFVSGKTATSETSGVEAAIPRFKVFNLWAVMKFLF